jgi:hypothetical protein
MACHNPMRATLPMRRAIINQGRLASVLVNNPHKAESLLQVERTMGSAKDVKSAGRQAHNLILHSSNRTRVVCTLYGVPRTTHDLVVRVAKDDTSLSATRSTCFACLKLQ